MSKIEEMALKAYPQDIYNYSRAIIGTEPPSVKLSTNEIKRAAFIKGAKAVLDEIEKAMKECDVDGSPFAAILDKIRELKQQ